MARLAGATGSARLRWPAEWEPHAATWLTWPKNPETWPGRLEAVERVFVGMTAALLRGERVRINVDDARAEERVRGLLRSGGVEPDGGVDFFHHPSDDAWVRDHGPLFVFDEASKERVVLDFAFDAWGGKYPPWERDDAMPRRVAQALGLACVSTDFVLEGGSIDGDGAGTVLTSEACLLHPNRGPGGVARKREQVEAELARRLGARRVLWLGEGIAGDDTDGHVDDVARFVSPTTIVCATSEDPTDVDHAPLQENLRRLRALCDASGRPYEVVELPMPAPQILDGTRLPASHANFYIANTVVLLPVFGGASDARAAAIIAECLPGREVVPIPARDLVVGLGAVHCLTQQEPVARPSGGVG